MNTTNNLEATLADVFGFAEFRDGQRKVCEALLEGRSAIAVFPTGGGKSLCYQLPALHLDGLTLVVSPLIALMKDQVDFLRSRGVSAARLDSSLKNSETSEIMESLSSGVLKLLYVAPERFLNERFLERLDRTRISLLAIDEAHCISQWGHNFRPDYLRLADYARSLKVERVLALTATATPRVVEDISAAFDIDEADWTLTGFYRSNLELEFFPVSKFDRDEALLRFEFDGPSIVYVTLQKTAERVAHLLESRGLDVRAYHAGMQADERTAIQDWFMSGSDRIVVATIAFGMGIDKADIRAVVHYNLPKGLEGYTQEIGRAGRDGKSSICRMLACRDDVPTLANFVYGDTPTRKAIAGVVEALIGGDDDDVELAYKAISDANDMRELVVKTLVTYLELDGYLRQTTPIYTEYKWKYLHSPASILEGFDERRGEFLKSVFAASKMGRTWATLDIEAAVRRLGEPRERIVRALDFLDEKGQIELTASSVRHRFKILRRPPDASILVAEIHSKFEALEARETARVAEVARFVAGDGCHWSRLAAYFGEKLPSDCGHCTFCRTGAPVTLTPLAPAEPFPSPGNVTEVISEHREALSEPRSLARFLCGITSPAITRARLSKHPLFGCLATADFRLVHDWCRDFAHGR